jgi:hypothetical protein
MSPELRKRARPIAWREKIQDIGPASTSIDEDRAVREGFSCHERSQVNR